MGGWEEGGGGREEGERCVNEDEGFKRAEEPFAVSGAFR
jgi:hypothetical protein